jgi:hypothetical protein
MSVPPFKLAFTAITEVGEPETLKIVRPTSL